ncbi:MAG TPA: Smr/MutS family protein [Candidatus Binatia bacterium]|nr:Smr/MutS family protein [Candidatus Binatia bacterium]
MDDERAPAPERGLWRRLRRLLGIVPALDLHGFAVGDALRATDAFLSDAAGAGEPVVRIVYGKGRGSPGGIGVLRQAVPAWIEHNARDRVERFERELDRDGHDGAMRVWLRCAGRDRPPS